MIEAAEVQELSLPFMDLVFRRKPFTGITRPEYGAISTLLSIKTGACPEDCAYCPQSGALRCRLGSAGCRQTVAARARAAGGGRDAFRMGAAIARPSPGPAQSTRHDPGSETLGLGPPRPWHADGEQALDLKAAGLDYYNHNLDTSPQYYAKIITTRTYQDRLDTLQAVRDAGMNVCCGGIVGMGEEAQDRAELLHILATLPAHPDSVPINQLVRVAGTPLAGAAALDPFDFVRTIAVAASSCHAATCVCRPAAAT